MLWASIAAPGAQSPLPPPAAPAVSGLSGIARCSASDVLLVSDEGNAALLRYTLPKEAVSSSGVRIVAIEAERIVRTALPGVAVPADLESVAVLADGRAVALSERLRALFSADGRLVASYDDELAELAERGLEGLAVRPLDRGGSRIAVVWEGGYFELPKLLPQLRPRGRSWLPAVAPTVIVHDLDAGAADVAVATPEHPLVLDTPRPNGAREPQAQRFRAPDLVWYRRPGAGPGAEWGFIALLSSQDAPRPGRTARYAHHWLQRFDGDGRQIGEPIDIDALPLGELKGANWEGADWLIEGRRLMLVNDAGPGERAAILVFDVPDAWRTS
jgi:hypothetical protein